MRVVIAGGHGNIALRLARQLAANGDQAVGIIRNPAHAADLRDSSAEPVVLDLESATTDEVAEALRGADAAVFAAGAGPGSGTARKDTVDRGAAALFGAAAELAGVRRHVQIGSMGVGRPPRPGTDEVFAAYLRAKEAAEEDLRNRDLDWTILRPGRLTDDPATGEVHLADSVDYGEISREDVASVIVAILEEGRTFRRTLEVVGGNTPIAEAVARI
ncbi:NAD(P)H-binding protein [Amycolatopsis acidiphila]|uniref:NAD-dependent epimerase/dehydratase family protein n=1 Tax=Amycolatopsis acidiphila TaxID=715473 RepID=A0A558AFZ0_9PSEU|nr:NAD(P)H-binding protein [Amycolatopsis acidiphila]TVT23136.1 NAD-dependent epimerase/dehydratase family protein [Amycolatopsis acidiphila]UIJ60176.1 NAD(P)H-binding protein [Amycolatopsis acidiphila]GHG60923.1 NAD-dependent dehydratase [Amycolatopsis acidiphila]